MPTAWQAASPMCRPRAAPFSNGWKASRCRASRSCERTWAVENRAADLGWRQREGTNALGRVDGMGWENRRSAMDLAELNKVACALLALGKGILAADESTGTIKRR